MIRKLDNINQNVSNKILSVFQRAYTIEAKLIGANKFPPLSRTSEHIQKSASQFYGFYTNDCLSGVIEINIKDQQISIESLTVHPAYFNKGIASKLITYSLNLFKFTQAIVETAVTNEPAINLYKKHGFVEIKQWTPSHGIPKIAFMKKGR